MTQHSLGMRYADVETSNGKVKVVEILIDSEVVNQVPAKDFHKWLKEKVREMGEWLETGKVQKWYEQKHIKMDNIDKDRLRYVG